jgi:AraC family transcriptional regulator
LSVNVVASCNHQDFILLDRVTRMHQVTTADPTANALSRAAEHVLVDKTTRRRFSPASSDSLLLTSAPLGWSGIVVEQHRLPPAEMPEHSATGHAISVNVGTKPTSFAWSRGRGGWDDRPTNPGHCRILTYGESNPSRWLQTYNDVMLIIDPLFVADVVGDGLAADRIEFINRHSIVDSVIADFATTFRAELAADAPNGVMYAESLTVALVLHLLANYGVAKPKVPSPRGKLNAFQLRAVLECIESQLDEDVSLLTLARQAHISPFHFARLFRATVGVSPHQFVLRLRLERAARFMKAGKMPLAQIAVECGFHDQPHFTRAFQRVFRITPAMYLPRR